MMKDASQSQVLSIRSCHILCEAYVLSKKKKMKFFVNLLKKENVISDNDDVEVEEDSVKEAEEMEIEEEEIEKKKEEEEKKVSAGERFCWRSLVFLPKSI